MNPLYPAVLQQAQGRCEYCHAPAELFNFPLEIDHILPVSAGGGNGMGNLALACHSCNIFKATRQQAIDPETSVLVPLFHPRRDLWDDHFEPSDDSLILY